MDQNVNTNLNVKDNASKAIHGISAAAEKMQGVFSHAMSMFGLAGGIGGVFAVHSAIEELNETYAAVGRVKAITGGTAQEAHGVLGAMESWGMELTGAERMISRMQGKMEGFEDAGDGAGEAMQKIHDVYKRIGIDAKKDNLEAQFTKLSEAAKTGKLHMDDLKTGFGVAPAKAGAALRGLAEGGAEFKKTFDSISKSAGAITDNALAAQYNMKKAGHEMHTSWLLLVNTVYTRMMPIVAKLTTQLSGAIQKAIPYAEKFGKILTEHADKIFSVFVKIAKMMAASKIAGMLGGGPLTSMLLGPAIGPLIRAVGMITENVNGWGDRLGSLWTKISMQFTEIWDGVSSVFGPALKDLGIDTESFASTILSVAEKIGEGWSDLITAIQTLVEFVVNGINNLDNNKTLQSVFGDPADSWMDKSTGVDQMALQKLINDNPVLAAVTGLHGFRSTGTSAEGGATKYTGEESYGERLLRNTAQKNLAARQLEAANAAKKAADAAAEKTKTPPGPQQPNFDFRGSRFDIKQAFAEGFDPDRIALAFSSDLASLGERSRQSNLSPLYAVRR